MAGSELSLRHLPDLSDASFSFQIPADSGDDLLCADSEDFFGSGASVMGSPSSLHPSDAPFTVGDLEVIPAVARAPLPTDTKTGVKFLLPTTRPNIHGPSGSHMGSKVPKPVPANRKVQHAVPETPAPGIPAQSTPIFSAKATLGFEVSNDANKISSPPRHLSMDNFSFRVPAASPATLVSPTDGIETQAAPVEQLAIEHKILPDPAPVAEEKTKESLKSTKPLSSGNIVKSTVVVSNTRQKAQSTAKTREDPKPTLPEEGTLLDNDTHSGIAGRLLMYGTQFITSFPQSDDDTPFDTVQADQGDAAMPDNTTLEQTHASGELSLHRGEPSPFDGETIHNNNPMEVDSEPACIDPELGVVATHDVAPLIPAPPRDDPLTLSQLSPRKAVPRADVMPVEDDRNGGKKRVQREGAISPMRPSVKRPSSATSADSGIRSKKFPSGAPRIPSAAPRSGVRSERGRDGARIVSAPLQARKQLVRKVQAASTKSTNAPQRAASTSTRPQLTAAFTKAAPKIDKLAATSTIGSSSLPRNAGARKANVPVELNFQAIGARREAEQPADPDSGETQQSRPKPYTIPDFKAMHATLAAQDALRRSQLAPTVPVTIAFSTDIRAKERELFDEKFREKERELEAAREVQRREREQEEAKELKDLRKRAIPKAHEVPGWYKEAPKRNHGAGQ
ncbi:hypothetical protein B0H12DRAFT_1101977 [Mycena haematopus]|nr:hypothetical protein B0H12DRAFT_1101977 [Mycena haematopus]